MEYIAKIEVSLKPGYSDPEGETIANSLKELGYDVDKVNVGKVYQVCLYSESQKIAKEKAEEMCLKLLANPIKDNFTILIEEKK